MTGGPATTRRGGGMAGQWRRLLPRPCHAASRRLGPGAPARAGLGAEVLGVLGGALGEVLAVLLGLLLGRVGGRRGDLLGDLLAPVQGLLAGLLDLVLDLVGHWPELLVLDPGRGRGQAGQEPQRGGADGQPQRVLLSQAGRPPGLLLDLATAWGGVAGPGRGPDHGLLGSGGGVAYLRLHVLHLVAHCVLGSGGDVGLVADGLDGLAHLGPGLGYVLSDRIWVLAHSTSSFTVSMVCSGTGGPAAFSFAWPCLTSTKATIPYTTATIRAASQAGMTAFRARMKQAVRAPRAASPSAPAPPNMPAPAPACLPFWVSSALASSSSWWTSRVVSCDSCLSSSPSDRSRRSSDPGRSSRLAITTSDRRESRPAARPGAGPGRRCRPRACPSPGWWPARRAPRWRRCRPSRSRRCWWWRCRCHKNRWRRSGRSSGRRSSRSRTGSGGCSTPSGTARRRTRARGHQPRP